VPISARPAVRDPSAPTRRAAYGALAALTAINLLNYLDRYLVPPLATDLARAMQLSDAQLGWLQTAFILVYLIAAPLFGSWGDRGSRTRPIALGIGLWSLATALSGLAQSYPQLLFTRALVGIGEASVVAIAPALLADLFAPAARARVFAVLSMAIPVGAALGYLVGGAVGPHYGWRAAFFVAGIPGFALAVGSLWLPDPPRGIQDGLPARPAAGGQGSALGLYLGLLKRTRFMLIVLGYAAYTFALGGLAFWMPAFLERVHGVPRGTAATGFGVIVLCTGTVGTVAGGWLADYFLRYSRQAYLWFAAVVTLLAVPLSVVALTAGAKGLYLPAIVAAQLLLFTSTGPVNAAIINIVSPLERASATALTMVLIHLLGDVPSPALIGYVSDLSSLRHAVLIVPVALIAGGLIWAAAALVMARAARSAA